MSEKQTFTGNRGLQLEEPRALQTARQKRLLHGTLSIVAGREWQ